jgi:hypothetical protein
VPRRRSPTDVASLLLALSSKRTGLGEHQRAADASRSGPLGRRGRYSRPRIACLIDSPHRAGATRIPLPACRARLGKTCDVVAPACLVEREQRAPDQLCKRDVVRVVGLRPAELVRQDATRLGQARLVAHLHRGMWSTRSSIARAWLRVSDLSRRWRVPRWMACSPQRSRAPWQGIARMPRFTPLTAVATALSWCRSSRWRTRSSQRSPLEDRSRADSPQSVVKRGSDAAPRTVNAQSSRPCGSCERQTG